MQIRDIEDRFWQQRGAAPTDSDLAVALNADITDVREARSAMKVCRPGSLDEPHGQTGTVADNHGGTDHYLGDVDNAVTVQRLLSVLDDRERQIVHLRFHQQWSQSRIGNEMGVSQMQISRWLRTITSKLHDAA